MDKLDGLLAGPRARSAFLLKAVFDPPWSVRSEDRAPLTVVIVLRGKTVLSRSGGSKILSVGDVVLVRGPEDYTLADSLHTPQSIRVLPGQICVDPAGKLLDQSMKIGVRTWGNSLDGEAVLLIGTYEQETAVGDLVLSRLPAEVVIPCPAWPVIELLAAEITSDRPGQITVLDRLLDLVVITALREVFATSDDVAPVGYAAHSDQVVGRAIRLMQRQPERPWSLALLALECSVSRATLARRFSQLVGEPPMTFLTKWRLALAADLLAGEQLTVGAIASRVGYSTGFALSTAFKREYRIAPTQYREALRRTIR